VTVILALDSSAAACSAALLADERLIASRFAAMARGQAEALMPMLREVMTEAGLGFAALDLLAVTTGPGSFTGIRVGLAAARGLALASGRPLLGVTSFAAIAESVPPAERGAGAFLVAIDSKREELFLQRFDAAGATPPGAPFAAAPEALAALLPPGELVVAGDGAARALAGLAASRRAARLAAASPPDARHVADLARREWRPGHPLPPARPLYLRPPDTTLPARPAPLP
jgi:tRNA threonylcarbamoyladenosine biosynthesis protein TsaB